MQDVNRNEQDPLSGAHGAVSSKKSLTEPKLLAMCGVECPLVQPGTMTREIAKSGQLPIQPQISIRCDLNLWGRSLCLIRFLAE
jgi:hypothetical protein